jgi:hypothetical protein
MVSSAVYDVYQIKVCGIVNCEAIGAYVVQVGGCGLL